MMVAMLSFGFASCGDDDDDSSDGNFSIVGKWTMYHAATEAYPERIAAVIVFNSDNTGTFEEYKKSTGESYGKIESLTYSLNGNALTFDIDGDTGTWYITIVSSKEFRTSSDGGLIFRKQ